MEVLIRMVVLVEERRLVLHLVVVLHRVVDVFRAGVLHLAVDVVPIRHSALLPDQRRTNPTQGPSVSYDVFAFYTKGDFPDIAHKTDCVSFVEYAYAVKTTQPNVPQRFRDAMKLADADLWRVAAEDEIKSLQDLNVFSLVPRSTLPPGKKVHQY